MSATFTMLAPAGSGLGGTVLGTNSGTVYQVSATGSISGVLQQDVGELQALGFAVVSVKSAKVIVNNPLPADTTGSTPAIVTQVTPTGPGVDVLTIAAQPPQARKLLFQMHVGTQTTTQVTAASGYVAGTDQDGNAVSDTVSLITAATAVFKTANCYASVTSASVNGYVASGSGTGNTVAIGVSNDFGIPTKQGVSNFALIKASKIAYPTSSASSFAWTVSDDIAASATVDTVARSVAPNTAPNASGDTSYEFTVNYV